MPQDRAASESGRVPACSLKEIGIHGTEGVVPTRLRIRGMMATIRSFWGHFNPLFWRVVQKRPTSDKP